MCNTFPTKVSCTILSFNSVGAVEPVHGFCILTQNAMNQYVFLALYIWYQLLFCVSACYMIYRFATVVIPQVRSLTLRLKIRGMNDSRLI